MATRFRFVASKSGVSSSSPPATSTSGLNWSKYLTTSGRPRSTAHQIAVLFSFY